MNERLCNDKIETSLFFCIEPKKIGERYSGHAAPAKRHSEVRLCRGLRQQASDERGPKLIAMKQGQHLDYDDTGMPWVTERLAKQFEARAASRADLVKLAAGESIQEAHIGPGKSHRG